MGIIFTDHAKKRCVQRKISEKWIEARLNTIPFSPSSGVFEQMLTGTNVFVVYKDGLKNRTIITLFLSIEIKSEPKTDVSRHLKDSNVRDMLDKAVGKSKRRGKRKPGKKWR